jgi:AcrR family transcriptional regulator
MGNKKVALERLQKVAAAEFARRSFDDVSIRDIAAQAGCSTATIYEIYGSKAGLYLDVRRAALRRSAPLPHDVTGSTPLQSLLIYAWRRIDFLTRYTNAAAHDYPDDVDREKLHAVARSAMAENNPVREVRSLVDQCQASGLIRQGEAAAIAYTICAGVGFDPVIVRLMFDSEAVVDPKPIIGLVFRCFVTRQGLAELEAFMDARPVADAGDHPTMFGFGGLTDYPASHKP